MKKKFITMCVCLLLSGCLTMSGCGSDSSDSGSEEESGGSVAEDSGLDSGSEEESGSEESGETGTDDSSDDSGNSEAGTDEEDSSEAGTDVLSPQDKYINNPPTIDQIDWKIEEGMVDGNSVLSFGYTNNSDYTIYSVEMNLVLRDDVTPEELSALDSLKEDNPYYWTDEAIAEAYVLAYNWRIADPGETVGESYCTFDGLTDHMTDMNQYQLFVPKDMLIEYSAGDDNVLYKTQYTFASDSYESMGYEKLTEWPDSQYTSMVPKLECPRVVVLYDSDDGTSLDAHGVTREAYDSYKQACIEQGFSDVQYDFGDSCLIQTTDGKYEIAFLYTPTGDDLTFTISTVEQAQ